MKKSVEAIASTLFEIIRMLFSLSGANLDVASNDSQRCEPIQERNGAWKRPRSRKAGNWRDRVSRFIFTFAIVRNLLD